MIVDEFTKKMLLDENLSAELLQATNQFGLVIYRSLKTYQTENSQPTDGEEFYYLLCALGVTQSITIISSLGALAYEEIERPEDKLRLQNIITGILTDLVDDLPEAIKKFEMTNWVLH